MLRNGPDVGEHSHEIVIAIPTGNDVKMEMIGNAGTCRRTDIAPDIKAIRRKMPLKNGATYLQHFHQRQVFIRLQGSDAINMPDRCDEQVTMGIGVSVQQDENLLVTVEEQVFLSI